jgi:hypothetical protein
MTILQFGSRGPLVKSLRVTLNQVLIPSPNLAPSETFDDQTRDAVVRFQRRKGITPNGVVDEATWRALGTETMVAARVASLGAMNAVRFPPAPRLEDFSFEDRIAAFIADAEARYKVIIPPGRKLRDPVVAQKWHIAHMIRYNSYSGYSPAKSDIVGGRRLIAWSHLSDPKTPWEYVPWEHFLRDADGNVPLKQGNAWVPGHAPDEARTRQRAFEILKAAGIGTDATRPNDPHSGMVGCGYAGCGEPCKCRVTRSLHVSGAARDLNQAALGKLEDALKEEDAGTLDEYLDSYGLCRPIVKKEPWHVEAKKP